MSSDEQGDVRFVVGHEELVMGVAARDQYHAAALELLRDADAFVLVVTNIGDAQCVAVHALPENHPDGRRLLLATIDAARRALAARNQRRKGN